MEHFVTILEKGRNIRGGIYGMLNRAIKIIR
jgi:hypothetical protein